MFAGIDAARLCTSVDIIGDAGAAGQHGSTSTVVAVIGHPHQLVRADHFAYVH